jgi:hypothetical protein
MMPRLKGDKPVVNLHPGDQVCVMAHCSREGQLGIVEGLLPAPIEEDQYQVCVIAFVSETGAMRKENYLVKDLQGSHP